MDRGFILKKKMPICDSFPLIVSHLCKLILWSNFSPIAEEDKDEDLYANISPDKAFIYGVVLADINRKLQGQWKGPTPLPDKVVIKRTRRSSELGKLWHQELSQTRTGFCVWDGVCRYINHKTTGTVERTYSSPTQSCVYSNQKNLEELLS